MTLVHKHSVSWVF